MTKNLYILLVISVIYVFKLPADLTMNFQQHYVAKQQAEIK